MMRWSCPEIYNAVCELSRFMSSRTSLVHIKAYYLSTRERGLVLEPESNWDGDPEFELQILGRSDSDYSKDPETRKILSGTSTFLCGAPII